MSTPPTGRPESKATSEPPPGHARTSRGRSAAHPRAPEPLPTGDHAVLAYTATPDARTVALTIGDPTHLPDLYVLDASSKRLRQLTHGNDSLFSKLQLVTPEDFWYPSFDGRKIETWILKPVGSSPGKKYPLILNIHGGPHPAYGYIFFYDMQWLAARARGMLYPEPRGSTTFSPDGRSVNPYRHPRAEY